MTINPAIHHVPLTTPRDYTRQIVREIAEVYGVSPKAIWTGGRTHDVIRAKREAIAAIMQAKPHLSFPDVGRMFGLDHTTIMHHAQSAGLPPKKYTPYARPNAAE